MTRSPDDLSRLNDSTQIALATAAAVTLGLPWQTDRADGPEPQSGLSALDSGAHGVGWLLIIGVVVSVVALVVDRRGLDIAAAVIAALAAAVLAAGIGQASGHTDIEIHSGPVLGAVLLVGCVASRGYAVALRSRR